MIYLDTSALTKLIFPEDESDALTVWIADRARLDESLTTSDIGRIELSRATARQGDEETLEHARFLSDTVNGISVTEDVVIEAQTIGPAHLRTLDAIHLASAVAIADQISAFVSYDKRLLDAAREEGLPVVSPGAE